MYFPRVLNKKKHGVPRGAVYVGRPSEWGNPYSHKGDTLAEYRVATLEDAIIKFDELVRERIKDVAYKQHMIDCLGGRDLVCWCDGLCHASVWLKYANEDL